MTWRGLRRATIAAVAVAVAIGAAVDYLHPGGQSLYYAQALREGWHEPAPRCPECATPEDLRAHILASVPALRRQLDSDPLAAVLALRDWTARTVDRGAHSTAEPFLGISQSRASNAPVLFRILDDDRGGTQCGGAATFFRHVAALFGFEAVEYNIGRPGDVDTHVLALVAVPGPSGPRFFPLDPWYATELRGPDGAVLDLESLAGQVRAGRAGEIRRQGGEVPDRQLLFAKVDLPDAPLLEREQVQALGCRPHVEGGRQLYACSNLAEDSFEHYFSPSRLGRPQATATQAYAHMLVDEVLSVYSEMSAEKKAALCPMLERIGVCGQATRPCRALCEAPATASGAPGSAAPPGDEAPPARSGGPS